jgi:hypothetical protein
MTVRRVCNYHVQIFFYADHVNSDEKAGNLYSYYLI